ncbi:MAG: hypothetical protein R3E39_15595 [Anaerolineae bacterium]
MLIFTGTGTYILKSFAGGDSLATALITGWKISDTVAMDIFWCAGSRQVLVYYFRLSRDDETMLMPVLGNPYVDRLLVERRIAVVTPEHPRTFLLNAINPALTQLEAEPELVAVR